MSTLPLRLLQRVILLATLSALVAGSGCQTAPKASTKYTFFPRSPNPPRIQFLTAFSSDRDLGSESTFVDYLTGRPPGISPLVKPYGLAISQRQIHVCDTVLGAIEVFEIDNKRAYYFAPRGEGRLKVPINISIDIDGTIYVADSGRNQVVVFGADHSFIAAIGEQDELRPTDVAIAPDRLYVTDLKHSAVRVYRKADRKLLFTIPRDLANEKAKLFQPTNLALDGKGHLLVSDTGGFRAQVFDLEGNYLRTVGQRGVAPGSFARPKGIAANREGQYFIVDASAQVVQMFDDNDRLLMYFGQPGESEAGELLLPAAVKVDYDNLGLFQPFVAPGYRLKYLILVTSQFGPYKVNIYGFVEKR